MITVKLKELAAAQASLVQLGDLTNIPASTSFRIARAIRKAKSELTTFEDVRRRLIQASGVAEPHPGIPGALYIDPAKHPKEIEDADAKLAGAFDAEVEIDVNPVKLAEFGPEAKLKPNWLADLGWLIVE